MRFSSILSIAALSATGMAAGEDDASFLTALVSDYNGHKADYVGFFLTAKSVPSDLTKLAKQVMTYTDDSYTTLLNNDDINVSDLKSYATNLPWYSRIQADAGGSVAAASASGSSSGSSSSSAGSGGMSVIVPGGAILGALAVALL